MSTVTDFHDTETNHAPPLSVDTVRVLLALIDSVTFAMNSPQVEEQFAALIKARRELTNCAMTDESSSVPRR